MEWVDEIPLDRVHVVKESVDQEVVRDGAGRDVAPVAPLLEFRHLVADPGRGALRFQNARIAPVESRLEFEEYGVAYHSESPVDPAVRGRFVSGSGGRSRAEGYKWAPPQGRWRTGGPYRPVTRSLTAQNPPRDWRRGRVSERSGRSACPSCRVPAGNGRGLPPPGPEPCAGLRR